MKQITFRQQLIFGLSFLVLCFLLAHLFQNGIFHNIAWIVYGLSFVLHPVWPKSLQAEDPKKMRRIVRIAGGICILIGLITRFGV